MCNEMDSGLRDKSNKEECNFKTKINISETNNSFMKDYRILIYISLIIIGMKMSKVSAYRNDITGLIIIGWMIFIVSIIGITFNIRIKTFDERTYKLSGNERIVKYCICIIVLSIFLLSTCEIIFLQFIGIILTLFGGYCIFEYMVSNKEYNKNTDGTLIISNHGLKIPNYRNIEWREIEMITEFVIGEELFIGIVVNDLKSYRLVDKSMHLYIMKKFNFLRIIYNSNLFDILKAKNKIIKLGISQLGNEFEKSKSLMEYHLRNERCSKI